jgi:MoaA/NifB/PqqE/SkfB family radical SAM enzyme
MRVQRVVTNETCNQNCWFCDARRPVEDPDFIARAAVRRRIAEACEGEAGEIILTGGEPTMRSDLADLVRQASAQGARVVLETNAVLIDGARAAELAGAGLDTARVQLVAWGEAADAITREPGGFDAALEGIMALADSGVRVEITTPIVRRNLDLVAAIPREIAAAALPVEWLVLVVPTDAPDRFECASLEEVGAAVAAVAESCRRVGLKVRLDPATYIPPCVFEKPERVAHLYALNRGNSSRRGFEHVEACAACLVRDRCPGFPGVALEGGGNPCLAPVSSHRLRRRLTVVSTVEEQIARELVGRDVLRDTSNRLVPEYTVRVNFHCNQSCEFCFVSTHLPAAGEAAVRDAISTAGRENAVLILSGGEPTLNPKLVEYVRFARNEGVRAVALQTNAIRLADPELTRSLIEAGVDQAMVSLHGSTAEISDLITSAPGTFEQTVLGIDELAKTAVNLRLNFVFCQGNYADFPRVVDLVARRWPGAAIVISFVGSHTDVVPRSEGLIPKFSDILPYLTEGVAFARRRDVELFGFDSMCGLPLCLVPDSERGLFSDVAISSNDDGGEFVKGEACADCAEGRRCYGIRSGYAELYGFDELRPFARGLPVETADGRR